MDTVVYSQDIYAEAKDKVDAKLQIIQHEYYNKHYSINFNAQI